MSGSQPEDFAPSSHIETFAAGLEDLQARGLRRRLRLIESAAGTYIRHHGRELICLCSNNYLGLATHPQVIAASQRAVAEWGWGAGASRLVSGHTALHQQLEERLAQFKHTEAALVCPTGYQANLAAIRALCGPDDVIFLDRLNHASIIDAARGSGARLRVFPHRDYESLESLLAREVESPSSGSGGKPGTLSANPEESGRGRLVIVTDSIFSMDGDFADLPRLVELKRRYGATLVIDEAHATGVFGATGSGLAEMMGIAHEVDLSVGTLSKALGGTGGFIAASRAFIDWVLNTAGPFIYTTAIPPAACAAAMAALDVIASQEGQARRERLLDRAAYLRNELTRRGWDMAGSESQIIRLMVGPAAAAVELSARLEAEGLLIPAIRPPTVPRNRSRLRLSLSSEHSAADLDRLLRALDRCAGTGDCPRSPGRAAT